MTSGVQSAALFLLTNTELVLYMNNMPKRENVILIILYYVWCNGRNCMQKVYECNFKTTGTY